MYQDKITVTLYSLQQEDGFDPYVLEEIKNIAKIKQNMGKAGQDHLNYG